MRSAQLPPSSLALGAAIGLALALCALVAKPALFVAVLSTGALALFFFCLKPELRRQIGEAPLLMATGMPALAWLLPSSALLNTCMVLIIPLLARNAGQVPALYLFGLMLLPGLDHSITIGSIKLFDFGVHDALAVGAAGTLLIRSDWRAKVRPAVDAPFAALLLLLAVALARDTSLTNLLRMLVNLGLDCALPYFIVSRGLRNRDDLRRCLLHLVAAAAVLSAILFYELMRTWPIYNVLVDHYQSLEQPTVKSRGGVLRAGGPFLEPTSVAMVIAFCVMAAWMTRSAFRSRLHHVAVMGLLLVGLVAPQSRGAWIGLVVGVVLIDLYRGRVAQVALRGAVVGVLGLALFAAAQTSSRISEMIGLSGGSVETVDYRENLFDRGMEELRDSPLVGFSYPEILARLSDLRQGEGIIDFVNAHLFIVLISGVLGLMIFNGAFLFYAARSWRARPMLAREGPAASALGAFVFAAVVTTVQMLFFTSMGGRTQILMFVFFAFSVVVARRVRGAAAAAQPAPISAPSFAFASNPMAMPPTPAASSSNSSLGFSSPIR